MITNKRRTLLIGMPAALCFCAAFCFCFCVQASPECPQKPSAKEDVRSLASKWFTIGSSRVSDGDFAGGRDAFLCSHSLVPHPASLLNAALSAQRATDVKSACELYEQFLALSDDGEKKMNVRAEMQIIECDDIYSPQTVTASLQNTDANDAGEAATQDSRPAETTQPDAVTSDSTSAAGPPLPAPAPASNQTLEMNRIPYQLYSPTRKAGTVLMTTGMVILVSGTVFQLMAAWNKYKGDDTTDGHAFEEYDENTDRYQRIATIGFISGGLLLITGLTLRIASGKAPSADTSIPVIGVSSSHSGVLLTHSF